VDFPTDDTEGNLDQFAHRVAFAGSEDEIVRLRMLKDAPHSVDIVARMPPVTLGVEVADIEAILQSVVDRSHGARDLAADEGLPAERALVIEEDAIGREYPVSLAVVHGDPIS